MRPAGSLRDGHSSSDCQTSMPETFMEDDMSPSPSRFPSLSSFARSIARFIHCKLILGSLPRVMHCTRTRLFHLSPSLWEGVPYKRRLQEEDKLLQRRQLSKVWCSHSIEGRRGDERGKAGRTWGPCTNNVCFIFCISFPPTAPASIK